VNGEIEVKTIEEVLAEHGGVFAFGSHCSKNGPPAECCILEMEALRLGIPCTDKPELVRMWDLRSINDAPWSSREVATPHLLRMHSAYVGSMDWTEEKQRCVLERILIGSVSRIISKFAGLPKDVVEKCKSARTALDLASALHLASARVFPIACDEALVLMVDVWVDAASEPVLP